MTGHRSFLAAAVVLVAIGCGRTGPAEPGVPESEGTLPMSQQSHQEHPYVGMWVTADNHIRQELLPDGRYDEARGRRASAYVGRYRVDGTHIEYKDDTGFTADGEFDGDVLHHGGYVFYREGSEAHRDAVAATGARRGD